MKNLHAIILIFLVSAVNLSHQGYFSECHGGKATSIYDCNGNYLKKVCVVHKSKTYEQANFYCLDNGMELFVIENRDVFEAFSTYMTANLPYSKYWGDGEGVWINGMRDINGVWNTFTPEQQNLNTRAVKWTFGPNYGDACLTMKRRNHFKVAGYRCDKGYIFICQVDVAAHLKADQLENSFNYRLIEQK